MTRRWFAVVAGAAVLIAGCSGSPNDAGPTTSTPSTATSSPPTRPTTVPDRADVETTAPVATTTDAPVPTTEPIEAGGETLGPLGSTEMDVTTDEGRVQVGTGEVPDGAAGVPLPDDFAVDLASETATDLGFSGTTALPFDEVVEFYRELLPAAGFEVTDGATAPGAFQILDVTDGEWTGNVLIASSPSTTDTRITIALQTG